MSTRNFISLGIMTGTSLDGVDLSIIKSDGASNLKFIDGAVFDFDEDIRLFIHSILGSKKRDSVIDIVEDKYTKFIISKIREFLRRRKIKIDIIGFHGQTINHEPQNKITWQIGNAKKISNAFKIKTFYDFRSNDIKNGGNGAPLTPIFHKTIKDIFKIKNVAFINLGGISNVTIIKKNKIQSFDMGPCCSISNEFIKSKINKNYDINGSYALKGKSNYKIIKKAMLHPYFKLKGPKSLDRLDISIEKFMLLDLHDGLSTINDFIAQTIAFSLKSFIAEIDDLILLGGGRKNQDLVRKIKNKFINKKISVSEEIGINGDLIESSAFAYLAIRSLKKLPITFPSTTGVKKTVSGGKFH